MVTVTIVVAWTIVAASWFHASVLFVGLDEKRFIDDNTLADSGQQTAADQDMV